VEVGHPDADERVGQPPLAFDPWLCPVVDDLTAAAPSENVQPPSLDVRARWISHETKDRTETLLLRANTGRRSGDRSQRY
jgi:hypothetical protein